jgi:hypothetical protein
MKKLFLVLAILFWVHGECVAGGLVTVEKLTDLEIKEHQAAIKVVEDANSKLQKIERKIAENHKMIKSETMEYKNWYEINGAFILYFHENLLIQIWQNSK